MPVRLPWRAVLGRDAGATPWTLCVQACVAWPAMETMSGRVRILLLGGLLAALSAALPSALVAQEEEQSLGEMARNLRREKAQQQASAPAPPPVRTVVDNDNLTQVMEDASRLKPVAPDKTVISLDSSGNKLTISSPDVTCSMSFNARAGALIVKPVLVEDVPAEELMKLDGPASIHDDNLQLDVFNGTDWALREITIGLTLERRPGEDAEMAALAHVLPVAENGVPPVVERHSDVTMLFHLRTDAKPFSRATLVEYVGVTPGPDQDWRWSIVEAKGIRPEGSTPAPESLTEPLFGGKIPAVPATNSPASIPAPRQSNEKRTPAAPGAR